MFERKSHVLFIFFIVNCVLMGLMFAHASITQKKSAPLFDEKRELVGKLQLTDLCLFTDARYTRHPTMADLNTPFQDHPLSFDHFPSGSVMPLPPHLKHKSIR